MATARSPQGENIDSRRIVFLNIPEEISTETLTNYVEVVSQEEVCNLLYQPETKTRRCLATFLDDIADVSTLQRRIGDRPLASNVIGIKRIPVAKAILVHGLDTVHSKDVLDLYFDDVRKSGGDGVLGVKLYCDISKATVEFDKSQTVPRVLERKHVLCDTELQVEAFYPEYHGLILEFLMTEKRNTAREADIHLPKPPLCLTSPAPEIGRTSNGSTLDQSNRHAPVPGESNCDKPPSRIERGIPGSTDEDIPIHSEEKDGEKGNDTMNQWDLLPFKADSSVTLAPIEAQYESYFTCKDKPDAVAKGNIPIHHEKKDGRRENAKLDQRDSVPVKPDSSVTLAHVEARDETDMAHTDKPDAAKNIKSIRKSEPIDEKSNNPLTEKNVISSNDDPVGASSEAASDALSASVGENEIVEIKYLTETKFKLLEMTGFVKLECSPCHVISDLQTYTLSFQGKAYDVNRVVLKMYEITSHIAQRELSLSHTSFSSLVLSPKGRSFIESVLNKEGISVFLIMGKENSESLVIAALRERDANRTRSVIEKLLLAKTVELTSGHKAFVGSPDWDKLVRSSEQTCLVEIVTDRNAVTIRGIDGDVDVTERVLRDKLAENCVVETVLPWDQLTARFVLKYCDIRQICAELSKRGIILDISKKEKTGEVVPTLHSRTYVNHSGIKEIQDLLGKIGRFEFAVPDDVAKTGRWRQFSRTPEFREWVSTMERSNECCLEANIKTTGSPPPSNAKTWTKQDHKKETEKDRPAMSKSVSLSQLHGTEKPFQTKPTNPGDVNKSEFQLKNVKVVLKSGDITKEKAVVLVNVVHQSLDLRKGALAKTFLQKGGQSLQTELNSQGDKVPVPHGKVITTSGQGLGCSHVFHVVLGEYQGPPSIKVLEGSVSECLQSLGTHPSIAFPSIGCGNLKFPVSSVAEVFSRQIQAFSAVCQQTKTVTLVIFDATVLPVFAKQLKKLHAPTIPENQALGTENPSLPDLVVSSERRFRGRGRFEGGLERWKSVQALDAPQPEWITLGPTKVCLKTGDITSEKAEVLVNVTNRSLELSSGSISRVFLTAGGEEMQQALRLKGKTEPGAVTVVESSGDLASRCEYVFHAVLSRWSGTEDIPILDTVVADCLSMADSLGVQSIAFPSLGCGHLRYPANHVARTMMSAVHKHVTNGQTNLKAISLVIFDTSIFSEFSSNLIPQGQPATPTPRLKPKPLPKPSPVKPASGVNLSRGQPSALKGVAFWSKIEKTKSEIKKCFDNKFTKHTTNVEDIEADKDRATQLLVDKSEHLKGVARKHNVDLEIDKQSLVVIIFGDVSDVYKAQNRMEEILKEKSREMKQKRKQQKTREEKEVEKKTEYPDYWNMGILTKIKTIGRKYGEVDPPQAVKDAIKKMAISTWQVQYAGHGRDSVGIPPGTQINITKIEMIQNQELFQKYFRYRQHLFHRVKKGAIPKVTSLDNGQQQAVSTEPHVNRQLKACMKPEVNEFFLFHGTKADTVKAICNNGIDFRVAGERCMFGKAVYLAESSTKADQYSDDRDNRSGKNLKMIVARAALGSVYLCTNINPPKFARPPCTTCLKHDYDRDNRSGKNLKMIVARAALGSVYLCTNINPPKFARPPCTTCLKHDCKNHPDFFDSIMFHHQSKNFREFMVYASEQCYPEFVVTYDRV